MEFLIVLQWTMTLQIGKGIMMANLDMSGEEMFQNIPQQFSGSDCGVFVM